MAFCKGRFVYVALNYYPYHAVLGVML